MERYDYLDNMKADILDYIRDNIDYTDYEDMDALREYLSNELWTADSVTGNASGSYYCNAWRAEEAIAHNWDLLCEAMQEFCCEENAIERGPEWCDVTIRCYLLGQAIDAALDEIEDEFDEAHPEEDSDDE